MKIALVQPFWSAKKRLTHLNDPWNEDALERHLGHIRKIAGEVDLVVFPEVYPWSGDDRWEPSEYWSLKFAQQKAAAIARRTQMTFISGGNFREHGMRSNAVMLATPGCREVQVYRKRLLWRDDERDITPGGFRDDVAFRFATHAVIPLICSDVFGENHDRRMTPNNHARRGDLLGRAAALVKKNNNAPIVVCAHSFGQETGVWKDRLSDLVKRCKPDTDTHHHVLYCNFASDDRTALPGGRSRMVSTGPIENRPISEQTNGITAPEAECATAAGVCICDLGTNPPTQEFKPYHLPR